MPNRPNSARGRNPGHTLQDNRHICTQQTLRSNPGQGDRPLGDRNRTDSTVGLVSACDPLERYRANSANRINASQSLGCPRSNSTRRA